MKKILIISFLVFLFNTEINAADTKLTGLTDITTPASGDDMYIVDDPDGTPASKKISVSALLGVATDLEDGGALSANTVDSSELVDGSVDLSHMSSASVDSDNIVNDTIANVDMADNSIDSAEYVDNSIDDAHINFGEGANQVSARDIPMAVIAGSTFSTVQHLQDIFHSAGWVSGGVITDDADGTISVASGAGLIRATDSATAQILFMDWSSEAGANVALADNDVSWLYVEYNAGSPQIIATTTERTDFNTNVLLAVIQRAGTTLHINSTDKHVVGDHANGMIRRLKGVQPYGHVSGGILSETGTRNIALTTGSFWRGLTEFSTSAVDTSGAASFSYWYNDGAWQEVTTVSDIHQTNYNDFGTGLATLSNNKYGVHWVYLEADDDNVAIVYGIGDYTLAEAEDAMPPSAIPEHLQIEGILAGKIIIKKSDAAFTQVESAFDSPFQGSLASDHNTLAGLQGGTTDEFYHMTSAQNTVVGNTSGTNTGDNTVATSGDSATSFFSSGAIDNVRLNLTAGRSLTESTNDIFADAELYTITKTIIIETPTSSDNFIMFHVELGMQVIAAHAIVEDATNATVQFLQCDSAGDNCTEITSPIVAVVTGAADDGVIDAPDLDVDDWVRCNITATSGTPGAVTATLTMTMDD